MSQSAGVHANGNRHRILRMFRRWNSCSLHLAIRHSASPRRQKSRLLVYLDQAIIDSLRVWAKALLMSGGYNKQIAPTLEFHAGKRPGEIVCDVYTGGHSLSDLHPVATTRIR